MNMGKWVWLNTVGVVALSVLCIAQWNVNRELNHEINRLESLRQDQAEKLDERDGTIAAQAYDLKNIREQLTELTGELRKVEGELALANNQIQTLTVQKTQLEANVKQWKDAVGERDKQIKFANEHMQGLVKEYNALAENYKILTDELNKRIEAYNELAKRRR